MAVSLYFGLPGCGKTTLMAAHALRALKGKRYKNVFCNVHLNIPGIFYIDYTDLGVFDISYGLVLIDEATLSFDSRAHKDFAKSTLQFFLMHRHSHVDVELFTQQWDGVDRKIRVITDRVYYVYKDLFFGRWITKYYRIPYGIIIPDPNKGGGEHLGDIVQGYCKPSLIERIFASRLFRPKYYKYFDSWECPVLPPLPADRLFIPAPVPEALIEQK